MSRHRDTIAALATPAGTSAIAVVRMSGPDTSRIVAALAGRVPPARVATHLNYRDRAGVFLDDVLLTWFAGPRSYTGEDAAEIGCHGNPFIARKLLEDLFARGCRPAEPGEFTQRAFLNGRLDLSQAEAVMDVIHARSERALAAANDQLRGALGRRMQALVDELLGILAHIEAYIDFPDEDLPPEDRLAVLRNLQHLTGETDRLLATGHYGQILREGIRTVIVGEPNVGKSSLLNRLVGSERALVSPEPGTTRDFIEERIMVGPHCLRLIDTAGLNVAPAPLEKLGMDRTRERLGEADVVLIVLDGSRSDAQIPPELQADAVLSKAIIILNKSDLSYNQTTLNPLSSPAPHAAVSALTGAGMDELSRLIAARADAFQTDQGEDLVAINARHAHALSEARAGLRGALEKLSNHGEVELVASDLRGVLDAFGQITGKIDHERMLDRLFASFCIGK